LPAGKKTSLTMETCHEKKEKTARELTGSRRKDALTTDRKKVPLSSRGAANLARGKRNGRPLIKGRGGGKKASSSPKKSWFAKRGGCRRRREGGEKEGWAEKLPLTLLPKQKVIGDNQRESPVADFEKGSTLLHCT